MLQEGQDDFHHVSHGKVTFWQMTLKFPPFLKCAIKADISFVLCDGFPIELLATLKSLQVHFHIVVDRGHWLPVSTVNTSGIFL